MNWFSKILKSADLPKDTKPEVLLVFLNDKKIGSLQFDGSEYIFEYEDGISEVERIVGVKEGGSKFLPIFFTSRIPSEGRPEVSAALKKHRNNPIQILGTLGAESAISPYRFSFSGS